MLLYHGIPEARIAARRSYPTYGNWKLVIENFLECYHCFPCHPEFCSVMRFVDVVARDVTSDAIIQWQQTVERWFLEDADPEHPVKHLPSQPLLETSTFAVYRFPIGSNYKTQSQDGLPVAPLMGQLRQFDGGATGFRMDPFIYFGAFNDHSVMVQFLPISTEATNVVITWLVEGSARDADVDLERLVWLWDVTTAQDKAIIERNAAGVRSQSYKPGPYSKLETGPARFVKSYLQELCHRYAASPQYEC